MKNYIIPVLVLIAAVALSVQSCEYEVFPPPDIDDSDTVSFSTQVLPILIENCLGTGCHITSGGVPPNLTADFAYLSLTGGDFLDLESPEDSKLYVRMIGASKPMPPAGKMPEIKTRTILNWIKQGALDN